MNRSGIDWKAALMLLLACLIIGAGLGWLFNASPVLTAAKWGLAWVLGMALAACRSRRTKG